MPDLFPFSVDFRPIGKCNLRCPFCFGPDHDLESMNTKDILRVIERLHKLGVKAIILSGGEPTLLPELHIILRYMKELGFTVVLSTNGILLREELPAIASYLNWLSLPLDSPIEGECQKLRVGCADHAAKIKSLMQFIRRNYPSVFIKLGTVVCMINVKSVGGILDFLGPEAFPHTWKLYQVSYSNYAKFHRTLLHVSEECFQRACSIARVSADRYGVTMIVYRNSERDGKYLFVEPNGDLLCIVAGDEVKIGNILTDTDSMLNSVICDVNKTLNVENFLSTYRTMKNGDNINGSTDV
jgi:MoaA/NifB/PqqE/SkfB family radical SAM enzyme